VPSHAALAKLLDDYAPLQPAPLCPEVQAFRADQLTVIWQAAERLAGRVMPAPFWAYPWPAGAALARVLLDHPDWVFGRRVLDLGAGGGVASVAAARAGAANVVANDIDPWALSTARLAAERQGLEIEPLLADLTLDPVPPLDFDLLLCGDMAYERRVSPRLHGFLQRARTNGVRVLLADAGRAYFDADGLELLADYAVEVPFDLEGVDERTARVYELPE
jgi:predicted nicotinamide N-methyase